MTAASLLFRSAAPGSARPLIPVGMMPARMPPGSAKYAPVLVANHGDFS